MKKSIQRGNPHIPGGKPSKMEDNPFAQKRYAQLIRDGIESEDDFPMAVSMDNYREVYPNPKNRKPLRERKYGESPNVDEDIVEWKLRKYLNEGTIPPQKLRKKSTKSKPKKRKICTCAKQK
jgi:hypothetical protein